MSDHGHVRNNCLNTCLKKAADAAQELVKPSAILLLLSWGTFVAFAQTPPTGSSERQSQEAFSKLLAGAQSGDPKAELHLGLAYAHGDGVPQDFHQAAVLYRKAAEQGNPEAENWLGVALERGLGVPENLEESIAWYRKGAEQGEVNSEFALGRMYSLAKDDASAAEWYRKAAEGGLVELQPIVAMLYEEGKGVPKDFNQAAFWYRKAAIQGNVNGEYGLGVLYKAGKGVPQNFVEAAKWFRLAAEEGRTDAQNSLGILYAYGQGVPKDMAEAYFWFDLAAAGQNDSEDIRKEHSENRDGAAEELAPAVISKVQARAAKWFTEHPPANVLATSDSNTK